MNLITFRVKLTPAQEPVGPHHVYMHLSAAANQCEHVGVLFRATYELEMLRGSRRQRRDGSVSYRFELTQEKAAQLRRALVEVVCIAPTPLSLN